LAKLQGAPFFYLKSYGSEHGRKMFTQQFFGETGVSLNQLTQNFPIRRRLHRSGVWRFVQPLQVTSSRSFLLVN
jgi:hypothetical protein